MFSHRKSWIALHSTWNLSINAWQDFYRHTNCSMWRKFAHSKGKLLTKIKFAQSKNLPQKFAHSRNLLTEFARSIEKLLTMKNLAGLDGSTQWLNVLHQANRSTVGAHHSTVSVVKTGTCRAGPSWCRHKRQQRQRSAGLRMAHAIAQESSSSSFGSRCIIVHGGRHFCHRKRRQSWSTTIMHSRFPSGLPCWTITSAMLWNVSL